MAHAPSESALRRPRARSSRRHRTLEKPEGRFGRRRGRAELLHPAAANMGRITVVATLLLSAAIVARPYPGSARRGFERASARLAGAPEARRWQGRDRGAESPALRLQSPSGAVSFDLDRADTGALTYTIGLD